MRQVMVRYKVKPDRVAENEALVRAVYDELHRAEPAGLRYATFRQDDGVSFVHMAQTEDGVNPLADVEAFARFQEGIGERCDEPPVVHLELHTGDRERASAFYAELLRWRTERIDAGPASYHALGLGGAFGGGIVQCPTRRPVWLPYVEVERVDEVTDRARWLGASVLLEPREGPTGWRSVVATPEGGEIAFWQPKPVTRGQA